MTGDTKSKSNGGGNNAIKGKKRKQRYLPHNPVKRKGSYPLRPGVQGFFITCDGGRESQASHEAVNVIDSFYEELVHGKDSGVKLAELPNKPLNKKIKFSYSESSSSGDDDEEEEEDEGQIISDTSQNDLASHPNAINEEPDPHTKDGMHHENQTEEKANGIEADGDKHENQPKETEEPPKKKQCLETDASKHVIYEKVEETSIDRLIEAELKELGDKNKRRFVKLDSGCNGVVFIQMRKIDGDPGPKDIVQHIMTSAASTRKHMSRFILRMLPIEVACYTSEEEISRAIKPLVAQYFPVETQNPQKFAVLFEARANSGIDRMKIINAVAKSVPGPHKVDLNNPDKTIVVEIIKTVCLIGVVEQYKGLAKYNLRQLTSPKP
ncbi:THUMP domain-containing protein 1 homolog isoform X2 [Juglans microcarpa x Juglans regia]|uniref:THUMP domain-containing protein 1 homolog isoform X2 n=1 Tax=Juglans microcarpa x Juglans regia TaxID=2249226 RepID=UPI001B7F1C66|nr:THUMP domain-containing protein 1 homolog isoform X2 [Juglans microcarpa x Juglans regia]